MIKVQVKRAQLDAAQVQLAGIDVAGPTSKGLGRTLAPSSYLRQARDLGTLSEEKYHAQYREALGKLATSVFDRVHEYALWNGGVLLLYCTCQNENSCHVNVLIEHMTSRYRELFSKS